MSDISHKQDKNFVWSENKLLISVLLVFIGVCLVWLTIFILRPRKINDQTSIPCPNGIKCNLPIDNTFNSTEVETASTSPTFSTNNSITEPDARVNQKPIITGLICDPQLGVEYTIPEGWELRRKYKDLHIVSRSNTEVVQPFVTGESDLPFGVWIWKRVPPFGYGWSKNITLESVLDGSTHVNGTGQQLPFSNANGLTGIILSGMSVGDTNAKSVVLTDGVSIISFTADGAGYPISTDANDISVLTQIASSAKIVQVCKHN